MPLRYVVLLHEEVAQPHFDLMFQTGEGSPLATWRLGEWPVQGTVRAVRLGDHRLDYLQYEGPLAGGRGKVRRVAEGECDVVCKSDLLWELILATPEPRALLRLLAISEETWTVTAK